VIIGENTQNHVDSGGIFLPRENTENCLSFLFRNLHFHLGVIIDSAVAPSLIGIYVKDNWPILLLAVVIGGAAVYFLIEANKKNAMPAALQLYKKEQEK